VELSRNRFTPPEAFVSHVDVTKFGNIPDGGGWRYVGRKQGKKNSQPPPDAPEPPEANHPSSG